MERLVIVVGDFGPNLTTQLVPCCSLYSGGGALKMETFFEWIHPENKKVNMFVIIIISTLEKCGDQRFVYDMTLSAPR